MNRVSSKELWERSTEEERATIARLISTVLGLLPGRWGGLAPPAIARCNDFDDLPDDMKLHLDEAVKRKVIPLSKGGHLIRESPYAPN